MRYLFAIMICGLGAWSVYSITEERGNSRPKSAEVPPSEYVAQDQLASPAKTMKAGKTDDLDLGRLALPAISDPLAGSIHSILLDLVKSPVGLEGRAVLEERLTGVMLAEKLGDETTLRNAARAALDKIVRESESARGAGTSAAKMTPFQERSLIAMSGRLAGSLRRAMTSSRNGGVHDGPLLSVDLDFDVPPGYVKAPWGILGGFRHVDGMKLPESVTSLNGKKVGLSGYMMATGEFEDIHVFAVVESQWSCCFGQPPDVHQVIDASIPDDQDGVELVAVPILVLGTLEVGELIEDGWVISVYRMKVDSIDVLE